VSDSFAEIVFTTVLLFISLNPIFMEPLVTIYLTIGASTVIIPADSDAISVSAWMVLTLVVCVVSYVVDPAIWMKEIFGTTRLTIANSALFFMEIVATDGIVHEIAPSSLVTMVSFWTSTSSFVKGSSAFSSARGCLMTVPDSEVIIPEIASLGSG